VGVCPEPLSSQVLYEDRERADSFGANAERYDRARPSYPAELVDALLADQPQLVLDVGCGTGIASRLFIARGCRVLAVEPDSRMAAVARRSGIEVEISRFEDWDAAGRTFDLLISGQAWHWVDPVAGAAKAAVALRPGGRIGLFWNWASQRPAVKAALDDVYARIGEGIDKHSVLLGNPSQERHGPAGLGLEASGAFGQIERRSFPWERRYTRDEWLDQLPTHSDHGTLPPEQLEALTAEVGAVINQFGGELVVHYDTVLATAVRLG
jgi:SAM-dependent methyltransferase